MPHSDNPDWPTKHTENPSDRMKSTGFRLAAAFQCNSHYVSFQWPTKTMPRAQTFSVRLNFKPISCTHFYSVHKDCRSDLYVWTSITDHFKHPARFKVYFCSLNYTRMEMVMGECHCSETTSRSSLSVVLFALKFFKRPQRNARKSNQKGLYGNDNTLVFWQKEPQFYLPN